MNYADIKAEAKRRGCRPDDLVVLALQNDPYYQGQPEAVKKAEWFAEVWERGGYRPGTSLRVIHYRLVSTPGAKTHRGTRYRNTLACLGHLGLGAKTARYLGLVDIDDIEDAMASRPQIYASEPFEERRTAFPPPYVSFHLPEADTPNFGENYHLQAYHLEVWIEKSTMDRDLGPVCEQYQANLQSGKGHFSLTRINDLVQRVRDRDKPARVFYISDFDPGGADMPIGVARKIEWLVREGHYSGHPDIPYPEIKLMHLALTAEQVDRYDLPRMPTNPRHASKARFERRHGSGAVELDALEALHPGELASIVEAALADYWDDEIEEAAREAARRAHQDVQDRIDAVIARHEDTIQKAQKVLQPLNRALREIGGSDYSGMGPDALGPDDVPGDGTRRWLYESARHYWEQLAAFKAAGHGRERGDHR